MTAQGQHDTPLVSALAPACLLAQLEDEDDNEDDEDEEGDGEYGDGDGDDEYDDDSDENDEARDVAPRAAGLERRARGNAT